MGTVFYLNRWHRIHVGYEARGQRAPYLFGRPASCMCITCPEGVVLTQLFLNTACHNQGKTNVSPE